MENFRQQWKREVEVTYGEAQQCFGEEIECKTNNEIHLPGDGEGACDQNIDTDIEDRVIETYLLLPWLIHMN